MQKLSAQLKEALGHASSFGPRIGSRLWAFVGCIATAAGVLALPTAAQAAVECDVRNTRIWPQVEACRSEARSLLDEGTQMWARSQTGWLEKLKEARQKSAACSELNDRARTEAKSCRTKREQEIKDARNEADKVRRRAREHLAERTKAELRREALRKIGQLYPDLVKTYTKANTVKGLVDGIRTLTNSRQDAAASLAALTQSVLSLRYLPTQPPGTAWVLSRDLLRAVLREYRSIVTDALAAFDRALAQLDAELTAYKSNLSTRLRDFLEKERRWRTWMRPIQSPSQSSTSRANPGYQRQAPPAATSTCPPGWAVDYYYGTACTCRGTSTMSIASAWANYRQYGACR